MFTIWVLERLHSVFESELYLIICAFFILFFFLFFQSDRFQSGIPADFYRSKAQTASQKASPSSFSSFSSFQALQKQRPPADQLLGMQAEGDLLLGALRQYLSGHLPLHGGGVSPEEQQQQQQPSSSRLRPFYNNAIGNSGLKIETSKSRLPKMGRTQGASVKDPLTYVDGTCLELHADVIIQQSHTNTTGSVLVTFFSP